MDTEYIKYIENKSYKELIDILEHIDKKKYPERVQLINERLEEPSLARAHQITTEYRKVSERLSKVVCGVGLFIYAATSFGGLSREKSGIGLLILVLILVAYGYKRLKLYKEYKKNFKSLLKE